jgi:hypothetical protein
VELVPRERIVLAIYQGSSLDDLRLLGVSSDRGLVAIVAARVLDLDEATRLREDSALAERALTPA